MKAKLINKTAYCCADGIITCPGCDGEKESEFGVCAGCEGVGLVGCGKCGGKEPKQETLEEAAKKTYQKGLQDDIDLSFYDGVRLGAKWQAERMYSEEDMNKYGEYCASHVLKSQIGHPYLSVTEWFEQFKTK